MVFVLMQLALDTSQSVAKPAALCDGKEIQQRVAVDVAESRTVRRADLRSIRDTTIHFILKPFA
jgi:hypothetical protein